MRRLLFTRHYTHYTGGHGKVLDYIGHAQAHARWTPLVSVDPGSAREANPFLALDCASIGTATRPVGDDALFLAGDDWLRMPPDGPDRVVINLVQGIRHADPGLSLHGHLSRRAIRICVSQAVADAVEATGLVRGPMHVIPAALAIPDTIQPGRAPREGIFVYACKQPVLGRELAAALRMQGHRVDLQTDFVERPAFLSRLASAEIAIPLPLADEGFFLPGLEAMALGCLTIGVDAGGNRAYLQDGVNAAVAAASGVEAILAAVERLPVAEDGRRAMRAAAAATAARFSPAREREAFHALLDDVEAHWAATCS